MPTKKSRQDIIDKLEKIFVEEYKKTYGPDLACTVAHAWIGLLLPVIETLLEEARQEAREEMITYISKHQGWEETEDNYRERFGFAPKYSSL